MVRARHAACVAVALTAGCLTNVKGDARSGKDQKVKSAKKIAYEDGEGRSRRDIVTYPGGDRVDWKTFQIPEGAAGTLRVKLKFKPARPGMDIAFRLYDEYFERLGHAKPAPGSGRVSKTIKVRNAEAGMRYYVQVYAPRRIDAAQYRVYVNFSEGHAGAAMAASVDEDDLPDPPVLPAIPEVAPPAEPVPCPNDPTKMQPNCTEEPAMVEIKPVRARVVANQVAQSGGVIITVDKGKNQGIEKGWKGRVINSAGGAVDGGEFTVIRVESGEAVGKVQLSLDQIKANPRVLLTPP